MSNKFFNDAVIGNKNVRATFSSTGELLRAYYPSVDLSICGLFPCWNEGK